MKKTVSDRVLPSSVIEEDSVRVPRNLSLKKIVSDRVPRVLTLKKIVSDRVPRVLSLKKIVSDRVPPS